MPLYSFEDEETGEIIEVVQGMNEPHVAYSEDGRKLTRIFNSPNAAIDTKIDGSKENFNTILDSKEGSLKMGDVWDISREAGEKRVKQKGHDPVKEKYYKSFAEKRHGIKHHEDTSDGGN